MQAGSSFGELALLAQNCKRQATAKAQEEGCELAYMTKEIYQKVMGEDLKQENLQKITFL